MPETAELAIDWPLFGLRLRTDRLELRTVRDEDIPGLVAAARSGIHGAGRMPFVTQWTDIPDDELGRRFTQYFWRKRAGWSPAVWGLPFAVVADGESIGVQELKADGFPVLREVRSGSWLARAHQRRGFGTQMRAAVLQLAFAGLGAEAALTSAYAFNDGSLGVSRRLGYEPNGVRRDVVRGRPEEAVQLRLGRARWEELGGWGEVEVEGLDACLDLFGLCAATVAGAAAR